MQDLRRYYDKETKKFFYSGWHEDENGNKFYKAIPDFALRGKMDGDAYTGKEDKNGEKIFENDFVLFPEHVVGDYKEDSTIEAILFEDGGFNDMLQNVGYSDNPDCCEIVGNCYVGYFKDGEIY